MKKLFSILFLATVLLGCVEENHPVSKEKLYLEKLFPSAKVECVDPDRHFFLLDIKDKYYTAVMCQSCPDISIDGFYGVD